MTAPKLAAGITRAGEGEGGVAWNILGQTYRPVAHSEACFAFEATFPPGTFVPPHVHPTQDEFIRVLDGVLDLFLDGQTLTADAGDLIRLPMGLGHGLFNRSAEPTRALGWVAPAGGLYRLFTRIHDIPDPEEVMRIARECGVEFLPASPG